MTKLSEIHSRHILNGFLRIHKQLAELEALLVQCETASPFSRVVKDLSTAECRALQDHFAQIRAAMLAHLEDLGIPLEIRATSVRWTVETSLMHIQTAVDDMRPKQLAGYGELGTTEQAAILKTQEDLTRLLERVRDCLRPELGSDPRSTRQTPGGL